MLKEYLRIDKIEGPLIFLKGINEAKYGEIIEISVEGQRRLGKVIKIDAHMVVAQVFEGTSGMSTVNSSVRFTGQPLTIGLSKDILGRMFNGVGEPIDGGGPIFASQRYNINSRPINPVARQYPRNFIETGISTIDTLFTLIRGQKLPIFSGNGLTHKELAAQIVSQAKIASESEQKFAVCFVAIGITKDDGAYFVERFEESGTINNVVMFMNYADDPVTERLSIPKCALTAAEYLAFEADMHILVVMTDMTSYCEALREIASAKEEVPSRKGYPGYLYSDLAFIYERAGMLKTKNGSITFLPILTMPNDDITHPIPDLTGYITEGQIVLSRELSNKDFNPPINVMPSLSRLMKDGIGEGFTREDHPDLANQLFSSYSKVLDIRSLAQIIGEADLSDIDKHYMTFGKRFEEEFVSQGFSTRRTIEESLNLGWELLGELPPEALDRLNDELIRKYYRRK
ncbi:MAG: V-type ATP synthase subunit B [Clostridiales bacterium 38-18]|nr:MAG: V-type ATP synthase subunit B [Clostridiales bacterium 38-18]